MTNSVEERLEQFGEIVRLIRQLIEEGSIFVRMSFMRYRDITLLVERGSLQRAAESSGVDVEQVESLLEWEIPTMMLAALDEDEEAYIEFRIGRLKEKEEDVTEERVKEEREWQSGQLRLVKERLVTDELVARYRFKKDAKTPAFTAMDWEVKVKHFDSRAESELALPYATLQLTYEHGPRGLGVFPEVGGLESVEVDCTPDEIEYLIRVLGKARARLKEIGR